MSPIATEPSNRALVERGASARSSFQLRVSDLLVLVLGVGLMMAVGRHVELLGNWPWEGGYAALGVVLTAPAAWLLAAIVAPMMRRSGRVLLSATGSARSARSVVARRWVWRALAIALLLGFAAEETLLLKTGSIVGWNSLRRELPAVEARMRVLPVCALLGMIGLVLGMKHPGSRAPRSVDGWRQSVARVLVAGGLGVLILVLGEMMLVHLIVLAISHVGQAMKHPPAIREAGPLLRIARAAWPAFVAAGACLASACWLASDLRRAARGAVFSLPSWAVLVRVLSLAITAASAVYLVLVTVPSVHAWLGEGFAMAIGRAEALIIAAGFSASSAGIVGQVLARGAASEPGADEDASNPSQARLKFTLAGRVVRGGLILLLLSTLVVSALAIVSYLSPSLAERIPPELRVSLRALDFFKANLWFNEMLFPSLALVWLTSQVIGLLGRVRSARPAVFDLVASDDRMTRCFLGYTASLAVVCLAALPTFFVSALVVYNEALVLLDWSRYTPLVPM